MKLLRLIELCLNKMYSKVHIGKHLSDSFPIQNGPSEKGRTVHIGEEFVWAYLDETGKEKSLPLSGIE
jgi:hypothetical protein